MTPTAFIPSAAAWAGELVSVLVLMGLTSLGIAHVLLYKRHPRAAAGWIALLVLSPGLGLVLYALLGINRVHRKATKLAAKRAGFSSERASISSHSPVMPESLGALAPLGRYLGQVTHRPLVAGNHLEPLINGDACYPAMLQAIHQSKRHLALMVYVFDNDPWGRTIADALGQAVARGVQVLVLIDGLGSRYRKPILSYLRERQVPYALWSWKPWDMALINLRNHRKLLISDDQVAFTGGMNIRGDYVLGDRPKYPAQDLHFRVKGPIIQDLMAQFIEDWQFATGELLDPTAWLGTPKVAGTMLARVIPDGPNHQLGRAIQAYMAGLTCAQTRVRIVTPYFLPESELVAVLGTAARRGVQVQLYLPKHTNPPFTHWAMQRELLQVLRAGCEVYLTAEPFDHTKLMVVDDRFVLLGSSNWDPRSLRLNFELLTEVYSTELATQCHAIIDQRAVGARRLYSGELPPRSLLARLRNGVVRLFKPYL